MEATIKKTNAEPVDYSQVEANRTLTAEQKIRFLRDMTRIRRFEQVALKHYKSGQMGGFLHLYIGQESVAVGTVSLMGDHDHVITAYRDHGHALACGMGMNECMAELFGRSTGCSKGKGGSMHFFAPDKHYWGGHGVVAGQTPLGLGIAFALKYKGLKGCCLCFLGDGAVNQGSFHESLNLASLWDIPVVYVIENNGYSMGTSLDRSSALKHCLAERAEGYNIDWDLASGDSLYEVRAKTKLAMDRAREQSRPTILEIATYRYQGHSVADSKAKIYRTPEEIGFYQTYHDPLRLWRKQLIEEGIITEEASDKIDKEAREEADASAEFAMGSDFPREEDIFSDIYYEVDRGTEAGRTGKYFFNE